MLRRSGFGMVAVTDMTDRYLDTAKARIEARDRHRAELERWGCTTFAQEQRDRRSAVAAIEAGWLRRELVTAARPADPLS